MCFSGHLMFAARQETFKRLGNASEKGYFQICDKIIPHTLRKLDWRRRLSAFDAVSNFTDDYDHRRCGSLREEEGQKISLIINARSVNPREVHDISTYIAILTSLPT